MEPVLCVAELAIALSGQSESEGRGHIYTAQPTGLFEDNPNLTNKRFPGNPTQSYRSQHPLHITGIVET